MTYLLIIISSIMYKSLIRPILFLFPPETSHSIASFFLRLPFSIFKSPARNGKTIVMGIEFPSRLGMAAGFDKNATLYSGLSKLGFGFVEIGTVTPKPQPGNDKPRLFRLKKDKALINRMGFNNDGIQAVVGRLKNRNPNIVIGGNIGKNKVTPNEGALSDYLICMRELKELVNYFVVNVSSPNTPGLRELQEKEPLTRLLKELKTENESTGNPKPLLLKIAPDLNENQLNDIIDIVKEVEINGVVATNTTIERSNLSTSHVKIERIGNGGLSGDPLKMRSLDVVKYLRDKLGKGFIIIGVGGVSSGLDAKNMINAGADLVQIYTGFIYGGPPLIHEINREMAKLNA